MSKTSNKRPSMLIPLDRISLDSLNPRIAAKNNNRTQIDLLNTLFNDFTLTEIIDSMLANGYFEEEPIVVIPSSDLEDLDWDSSSKKEIERVLRDKLTNDKDFKFIVVEGNRRVSAAKLITDSNLRGQVESFRNDINPAQDVLEDLSLIPAIIYPNRQSVVSYLGVRHIVGVKKWETYSQVKYTADIIKNRMAEGVGLSEAISYVQTQIGNKTDKIKKNYVYALLLEQIERTDSVNVNILKLKERFSILMLAFGRPSIRKFVGLDFNHIDNNNVIPEEKIDNLQELLTWIYGNDKKEAIITDSRQISKFLAPILDSPQSIKVLRETGSLQDAYEQSEGEKEFLVKKINTAKNNVQRALSLVYKYSSDSDIKAAVSELNEALEALKKYC